MKKKLLTVVALIALVMVPTFAKSSDMSAGLALGTINGVGFKYNVDKDITVGGTLGFDIIEGTLNAEGFGLYKISEFQIEKENFDVNAGAGASLNVPLKTGGAFSVSVLGMGEVSYSLDNKDFPLDFLLRLEPGIGMTFANSFDAKFVMQGSVQALWRF